MSIEIDDPILIKLLEDDGETEESKNLQKWTKNQLLSNARLATNFGHVNIYNKLNYENGTLDKLESLRDNFASHSIPDIIDILYTVGYSHKAMSYLLYKYGYNGSTPRQIRTYIQKNKFRLLEKRREFMSALALAKEEIFQIFGNEVKVKESETIKILLEKIKVLQDELRDIDPVADSPKFTRVLGLINKIQNQINDCHGITEIRKAYIEVEKAKAIDDHRFDIDMKKLDHAQQLKALEGGKGNKNIIEADSSFVVGV